MADVAESAAFTDPATAISHGKRHLLVRDYTMAVTALEQACQMLAEKHGDTADELGEPYLLYGRALLGLAREEAGVLGGAVPGTEGTEEDEDEDEEEAEEEKLSNVDEKEEEEDEGTSSEEKKETDVGKKDEDSKTDSKPLEADKKEEKEATVEKKETEKVEAKETDDTKVKSQPEGKQKDEEKLKDEEKPAAGSSKDEGHVNGPSCSREQNGVANGEDDGEDIEKEDEEEEVNNLQIAWEVLELAKVVLLRRGKLGWKLLADTYRLLGEVAMEGGNFQGALSDLQTCLEILHEIEPREPRAIAEIHYQLALAHSLGNEFDSSIEEFNKATELLEGRIKELEEMKEPPKTDDSFYTVAGEIQELKDLLPEIREKISDMKDFKQEACKLMIESIKSKVAGGCSNGAGPSGGSSCSSSESPSKVQKPASDISHLVRKKRKGDESEPEVMSPCKKPTPEKAV